MFETWAFVKALIMYGRHLPGLARHLIVLLLTVNTLVQGPYQR
jgi:hypothetical protein